MSHELVILDTQSVTPNNEHPTNSTDSAALVYLARLTSANSRRTMRCYLDRIAAMLTDGRADCKSLPWGSLRYQHTQALRTLLAETFSPSTASLAISALRGTLKEAWRLGQMTAEECERACDLPPIKGTKLPTGRALETAELRRLIGACPDSILGFRDKALFHVLFGCGLRRAEAVALDRADYDERECSILVRCGKGRKERIGYLNAGAVEAVNRYISTAHVTDGPLFRSISKAGKVLDRRLTAQAVYVILQSRSDAAGIGDVRPHDMRRTFCTSLLDAGVDLGTTAKMMGHANVATTMKYDKRGEKAKRAAADLLSI